MLRPHPPAERTRRWARHPCRSTPTSPMHGRLLVVGGDVCQIPGADAAQGSPQGWEAVVGDAVYRAAGRCPGRDHRSQQLGHREVLELNQPARLRDRLAAWGRRRHHPHFPAATKTGAALTGAGPPRHNRSSGQGVHPARERSPRTSCAVGASPRPLAAFASCGTNCTLPTGRPPGRRVLSSRSCFALRDIIGADDDPDRTAPPAVRADAHADLDVVGYRLWLRRRGKAAFSAASSARLASNASADWSPRANAVARFVAAGITSPR